MYWSKPRIWSTKTKNIEKSHCISVKEKISPFQTERAQTYLNSTCTCLCTLSILSISLCNWSHISLSALKAFNLAVHLMARLLPREGAGLIMDLLWWVFWWPAHRNLGLLPVTPQSSQNQCIALHVYSGFTLENLSKGHSGLLYLQVPLFTIDPQLPKKSHNC